MLKRISSKDLSRKAKMYGFSLRNYAELCQFAADNGYKLVDKHNRLDDIARSTCGKGGHNG